MAKSGLIDWVRTKTSRRTSERPTRDGGAVRSKSSVQKRYSLGAKVPFGGLGTLEIAQDRELLRTVAFRSLDGSVATEAEINAFIEEAQIMAQLDHPGICPVLDVGKDTDERYFFTLKNVHGRTLSDLLSDEDFELSAPDTQRRLVEVLHKVCDTLAFAHSKGVVHCDVTPANILVGEFGEVYVTNWAGAQMSEDKNDTQRPTRDHGLAGTLAYMSPEIARGHDGDISEKTDVFGVGAVLYSILTLEPLYAGRDLGDTLELAQSAEWLPPQTMVGGDHPLPAALCSICEKALSPAGEERHKNMTLLQNELDAFLRGGMIFPTQFFSAGAQIISEGDAGDCAYILQRGFCHVEQRQKGGVKSADLKPGDVFGETAVFARAPRTKTVTAVSDVTVQVVTRQAFVDDLGLASSMNQFVKALARRFVMLDNDHRALLHITEPHLHPAPRALDFHDHDDFDVDEAEDIDMDMDVDVVVEEEPMNIIVDMDAEPAKEEAPTSDTPTESPKANADIAIHPLALMDSMVKLIALSKNDKLGDKLLEAILRGVHSLEEENGPS